ncbi:hypothetical protein COLO4_31976 [Corchorus olitorius]|uniref:Uncharacterized protein n=1 Tax=Corchorus olitorius TaxID=93759 RepID=A0A1R3H2S1_9ROSI|nr:hypothetical protein COLO4_31976 [Corchorus olitorius]
MGEHGKSIGKIYEMKFALNGDYKQVPNFGKG